MRVISRKLISWDVNFCGSDVTEKLSDYLSSLFPLLIKLSLHLEVSMCSIHKRQFQGDGRGQISPPRDDTPLEL